jgi:RNA polymerase sigma factor (sigma-70 family)
MQPRLLRSPARLAGASLLRLQTDERLAALAHGGHEQAFNAIVERYREPLMGYARRLAGADRAEDVVQQALASAHTALTARDEPIRQLRPWLYRIVHNTALNALRSARDEASLDDAAAVALAVSDEEVAERRARLREALEAVAALPAPQRDAIVLRELEGRSHDEIAQALGVTPGAARQQIFRARTALRSAVTALTPFPLLARLLQAGGEAATAAGPGASEAAAGAAGAGLGALLTKAGVGVLATGAIVGGAVGTGVVKPGSSDQPPAASAAERPAGARAATVAGAGRAAAGVATPASDTARDDAGAGAAGSDDHGRRHRRGHGRGRGRSGDDGSRSSNAALGLLGHEDDQREDAGDEHGRRSGDDHGERSGRDGSGDDDRRRSGSGSGGSGSSGSRDGDGDRDRSGTSGSGSGTSGSGSGDDSSTSGSGSNGGSSSGSDDDRSGSSGSDSGDDTAASASDSSGSGSGDDDRDRSSTDTSGED